MFVSLLIKTNTVKWPYQNREFYRMKGYLGLLGGFCGFINDYIIDFAQY